MEEELKEKLKRIKAVVFDGDGVFFSGRVFVDPEKGEALKERSHIDGQGISLLRAIGIRVAMISGEATGFLEKIGEKLNSLTSVKNGDWPKMGIFTGHQGGQKVETIESWLKEVGVSFEECAAMGDDLADYQLLKKVGVAAAPAQAEEVIKKIAHYIAPREGGNGAIRDLCNLILEAKEVDPTSLVLR
ncbi:MAG: HAD hydrolase family protein [Candidatus Wildermuthbacteria bacterium]|nr:HAD hydrolase family protein [Candidatus Wildermuthbacteria bacterium]